MSEILNEGKVQSAKKGIVSRRAALTAIVGGTVAALAAPHAESLAKLAALGSQKPEAKPAAQAPAQSTTYGENVISARILTPEEAADRLASITKKSSGVRTAQASNLITTPFMVGNIELNGIPAHVDAPQLGPDVNGMAGSGEFFVPHGPHYPMGGEKDVVILPTSGKVDLVMGRQHQFGEKGQPGFTGYIEVQIPGNTMTMRSWAEAGGIGKFAYGAERREMQMLIEQWHQIENLGTPDKVGNWVNVREITMFDEDPGDAFARLRIGHARFTIAEMKAQQFPWTQFTGFDQIQPANFVNYAFMHRASNGKTWIAEAQIDQYPGAGQRRDLKPESHAYTRLYDNFTGLPEQKTIVKPVNAMRI